MNRKDVLLERVGNRTITSDEVFELCKLLEVDPETQKLDKGTKVLIALGSAALWAYLDGKEWRNEVINRNKHP